MQSYDVYDAETNILNNKHLNEYVIGNMKASPFHPDNGIVVEGWQRDGVLSTETDCTKLVPSSSTLVGQNIKFDMLYMLRYKPDMMQWVLDGGKLWCTMLAEYLLTSQQSKFISLDKLAMKYGGQLKDDRIKEFWDNNIDTADIPMDMLTEYLEGDIRNTDIVYRKQLEAAERKGMMPLIESQMEALMCTTLMEYNGMCFDKQKALDIVISLEAIQKEVLDNCVAYMQECSPVHENFVWNPLSNQQLAAYLFGGEVKYTMDIPVLDDEGNVTRYKSGKRKGEVKTKKVENVHTVARKLRDTHKLGANGYHPVGTDVLKGLPASQFIEWVEELRDLKKQVSTYFKGYSSLVWQDGCIHGSLNHTGTETGRLTSTKPNLQNISGKETEIE